MTMIDEPDVPSEASGRRFADYDVRALDDSGNECPPGVPGEIVMRPRRPGIMFQGYWRRPEATVAATGDMWFHTGDIGKFDERGFFYFVDRKKDYLRRGGENISSFEVETTFMAHPEVLEVAAHAVPAELSEDELKITIVLKPGATLSEEELCRWSVARLPHFAVPRYIEFRAELPKTQTGKLQKHLLRADGVTQGTWDRAKSDIVVTKRRATASA
jgi:crotonobetaine/carnitine-CoA ligase